MKLKTIFNIIFLSMVLIPVVSSFTMASQDYYLLGAGVYDITGPAAEVGMMGYSMPDQKTNGIHMRLRSRAYVIAEPNDGKRVVFVCADLLAIFQAVKQQVLEKLQNDSALNGLYDETNVLLSATHTHSGPGGYSHYLTYNASALGFIEENFNTIVEGIYKSIVIAHNNLEPGKIQIAQGEIDDCGRQRSYDAHMENPEVDENNLTDKTMTLLKLLSNQNEEIGLINWYAVHPNNIGNTNHLITGDNKGYASWKFEKMKQTDYTADNQKTFVAAFAQSHSGDVSPNIEFGYPDGVNDYIHMEIIAERQYTKALELYNTAGEYLYGDIDYRHKYINFEGLSIDSQWVDGQTGIKTCSAAIGFPQVAGSTEDGTGVDFAHEGMVWGSDDWPEFTLIPELQECQEEKIILFPAGNMQPYPWVPEVLPIQILKIGNMAIVASPFEITTVAGRRLRDTIMSQLNSKVDYIVISAPSNAYCSYITTTEEYETQHYEGGSTMFGPYTLNAFQQEYDAVATALRDNTLLSPGPTPRDLRDHQVSFQTGVVFDGKYFYQGFGDIENDAHSSYSKGDTVTVQFVGAHPKNNLMTQDSFLKIEKMKNNTTTVVEKIVAHDWDPETIYRWEREGSDRSNIIIEWTIPDDTTSGTYRIHHYGHWKSGWTGKIKAYEGVSSVFTVE